MDNDNFLDFIQQSELDHNRAREIRREALIRNKHLQRLGDKEMASLVYLLNAQLKNPDKVQVLSSPDEITQRTINELDDIVVSFSVFGPDWEGLQKSCISIINSSGLEIRYTRGFVVNYDEYRFGLSFMEVTPLTVEQLDYLTTRREELVFKLSKIAVRNKVLMRLQEGSATKVALFLGLAEHIRENFPRENIEAILGASGEAVKFFEARSELYIRERDIKDIARMIINNYNFARSVSRHRDRVMVDISNLEVGSREKATLTGITIAADLVKLSLTDCLNILDQVEPGFIRKHDKGFFRSDNIGVFRIEICTKDGLPFDEDKLVSLRKRFQDRGGKQTLPKLSPGVELIRRTIVPEMQNEEHRLGIPHVYVHPHSDSFLKIILVSSGKYRGFAIPIAAYLNQQPGFTCVAAETPSKVIYEEGGVPQKQEVIILDLWVDGREFFGGRRYVNVDDILHRIDALLKQVKDIGPNLRLFDITSRAIRRKRLDVVMEHIDERYDRNLVRDVFARLGDKYVLDIVVQAEEIAAVITLGASMLELVKDARDGWVCRLEEIGFGGAPPYPWLAIACPSSPELPQFFSGLRVEYRIKIYTIVESFGHMLLLVKLSRGGFVGQPDRKGRFMDEVTGSLKKLEKEHGWGVKGQE